MSFLFSLNTEIINPYEKPSIKNAVSILSRDMKKCLSAEKGIHNCIVLEKDERMAAETYRVSVLSDSRLILHAKDELGFVYGLLSLSERFLHILPFWFWMDQELQTPGLVEIPLGSYNSPIPSVRFRGWFLNDEVLLIHWNNGLDKDFPWRMAFEALLRCGGNMVIPGTDKNSRINSALASSYGLWLTHHHAEPLGAEIFARAYPDLEPAYSKHPDYFLRLWKDAIAEQKDQKVIWTLGFRGQGDCPFWESKGEENYDTPEKRGKLISDLIEFQRQLVCEQVEHPVFCTNLYGEIMELYNEGHITLHPDIIKVWADNGYGKMCSRRQGNHDPRVCSLPDISDTGSHGVYYHISFHDLQAASHMTTLPNSVDFVNKELHQAYERGIDDYWIINSSNIRPHVYYLDAIRKLWFGHRVSDRSHSLEFADQYFYRDSRVADLLNIRAASMLQFGVLEDQHAGEEFYNYCVRFLARQFIIDQTKSASQLFWLTGQLPLAEQTKTILALSERAVERMNRYWASCEKTSKELSGQEKVLFDSTVLLQSVIHKSCNDGLILFCQGLLAFTDSRYQSSFYKLGCARECFVTADAAMHNAEYGVWKGFYDNDCLADIQFTSYLIGSVMRVVRVIGDDERFADWYEDFVRPKADRKVRLLAITDHHMTDDDLFEAMKRVLES